ncbi:peptidase inhibitor family I36 protein [Amycolatopsis sp. NPDC024027]|uniref:peptidase inhibitor family I36 protein n=1 Tax=Amycolatopsis sp. NPDC024027 TaxID=3154327 RepID=UPI0034030476
MGTTGKRLFRAVLATGGAVVLLAAAAPAASAATARNGICETGEFCLYYGPDETGSVSDFSGPIPNYGSTQPGCYEFKGPGSGHGLCVKNHAKSARNNTRSYVVKIYYNSYYGGRHVSYNPGGEGGLEYITNENASHDFELVS